MAIMMVEVTPMTVQPPMLTFLGFIFIRDFRFFVEGFRTLVLPLVGTPLFMDAGIFIEQI